MLPAEKTRATSPARRHSRRNTGEVSKRIVASVSKKQTLTFSARIKPKYRLKNMSVQVLVSIIFSLLAKSAFASSYPNTYSLPWAAKSERLTYRSCGCADSCWIAELRERKSRRLKAVLRCDCSNLHGVYPANSSERELQKSCAEINDRSDKMDAVSQAMKRLVDNGDTKN